MPLKLGTPDVRQSLNTGFPAHFNLNRKVNRRSVYGRSFCALSIVRDAVLRIRIRRIHMFLDLLDPDPLVREVRIRILLSSRKNSKKNLDSCCFVTSF
jgi:hypothetical protein